MDFLLLTFKKYGTEIIQNGNKENDVYGPNVLDNKTYGTEFTKTIIANIPSKEALYLNNVINAVIPAIV